MAYEAQANRKEAGQHRGPKRHELNTHRKVVIRRAARATQLAYAYCRCRLYLVTERPDSNLFTLDYKEIARMIRQYGGAGRANVQWGDVWKWVKGETEAIALAA